MTAGRGALIDKCWRCGQWLRRATPEQHSALHMALIDISGQLAWPTPEVAAKLGIVAQPQLRGITWWWQMIVAAFDREKQQESELAPAIDGLGFDGRGFDFVRGERLRRQLNDHEISEIIEYTNAFAAGHGVKRTNEQKKRAA